MGWAAHQTAPPRLSVRPWSVRPLPPAPPLAARLPGRMMLSCSPAVVRCSCSTTGRHRCRGPRQRQATQPTTKGACFQSCQVGAPQGAVLERNTIAAALLTWYRPKLLHGKPVPEYLGQTAALGWYDRTLI